MGLPEPNEAGLGGTSSSSPPEKVSNGRGMNAMIPRAIEKQRTVSIEGLSVATHECIREISPTPVKAQHPIRIVWTYFRHIDSVPSIKFRKTQAKEYEGSLTKTATRKVGAKVHE
jgi:hypothetical protein